MTFTWKAYDTIFFYISFRNSDMHLGERKALLRILDIPSVFAPA